MFVAGRAQGECDAAGVLRTIVSDHRLGRGGQDALDDAPPRRHVEPDDHAPVADADSGPPFSLRRSALRGSAGKPIDG